MFEDGHVVGLDAIWANLRMLLPEDADRLHDLPYLDDMPPDVDRAAHEREIEITKEKRIR